MNLQIDPMAVGNGNGLFKVLSDGYVQGFMLDDPALRNEITLGVLDTAAALPMFGGIAIAETLSPAPASLGNTLNRATTNAGITGFAINNQAHNFIGTPSSPVPVALPGMSVPFLRMGSGARIVVACDEDLAATLAAGGSAIGLQLTWDYNAQRLMEYNAATASVNVTSITAAYDATTGYWTFAVVAAAATNVGALGDSFTVAGVTSTGGTAPITEINTNQIVSSYTNSQNFSFQLKGAAGDFAAGALAGVITLTQATGTLAAQVLEVQKGNSMIVVRDPVTGNYDWNRSGSTAVIKI
jgi:hypothetical protein